MLIVMMIFGMLDRNYEIDDTGSDEINLVMKDSQAS
jgi:hypothetical protein